MPCLQKAEVRSIFVEPELIELDGQHTTLAVSTLVMCTQPFRTLAERENIYPPYSREVMDQYRVYNFTSRDLVKVDTDGLRCVIEHEEVVRYERYQHGSRPYLEPRQDASIMSLVSLLQGNYNRDRDFTLNGKVVIIKQFCLQAPSQEALISFANASRISDAAKVKISQSYPKTYRKGVKEWRGYDGMLITIFDESEFGSHTTVLETNSGVCLSMESIHAANAHPYDQAVGIVDVTRYKNDPLNRQKTYSTLEIVFHNHPFQPRFLNDCGRVLLLPQVRDTTRAEGFYQYWIFPPEGPGTAREETWDWIPPADITEKNGFYTSYENARNRASAEQMQTRLKTLLETQTTIQGQSKVMVKDWNAALKSFYAFLVQSTDERRIYFNQSVDKRMQVLSVNEGLLKSRIEELSAELESTKRAHEKNMQARKETLEIIKIIPAGLAVVAAFVTLRKKKH